jgi:hypothetical protein
MPKSNFNQLIDECKDFAKIETYNKTNNKIIFENKQPEPTSSSLEVEFETKKQNNQNANTNSIPSSSNIFLSKNVNSRQHRFPMNKRFINGNVSNTNAFSKSSDRNTSNDDNVNVNVKNIFKKVDHANDVAIPSSSSSSMSIPSSIEINNETFPSLAPLRNVSDSSHGSHSSSSAVPKKFKNFKDAITASAPESVVPSPTKQKQIKALQELHSFKKPHIPPALLIKRESEMLAKTTGFYNNGCDDDDEFDHDSNREYGYSCKYKPSKKHYNNNDDSDD